MENSFMENGIIINNPKSHYTQNEKGTYLTIIENLKGLSIESANKILFQVLDDIKALALITV